MTMIQGSRRPLILKREQLTFHQNDPTPVGSPSQFGALCTEELSPTAASQCFPDGIRIMNHPSMSDTQVVVIPKTADLQSVIGVLTAKGKESGAQGPNKFILLSENGDCNNGSFCKTAAEGGDVSMSAKGQAVKMEPMQDSPDAKPFSGIKPVNENLDCDPCGCDDSLTNLQWLTTVNPCTFDHDPTEQMASKAQDKCSNAEAVQPPMLKRPPYSYIAMIQFAINSRKNKRMTLKEIYTWIEDHFPYFRDVAKPRWKNSIRHTLSLHDMFMRKTSPDGRVSSWTIRPEANHISFDPMYEQQKRMLSNARKMPTGSEKRTKHLPRSNFRLAPTQLPVASFVDLPSSAAWFPSSCSGSCKNEEPIYSLSDVVITESLINNIINDSETMSLIVGENSFPDVEDEDIDVADLSWVKYFPQFM